MAKRYSKNYSNYILKKKYQYTTKGTIWERDWVTIGAKHQIEKGKIPFFGDSGFLFTDNSFLSTQKRHDFGKVVAEWLYDDVKNAKEEVNKVVVNYTSDDLRDFAYYGSCVELIRASIFNILKWFPGCAFGTNREVNFNGKTYYMVSNPFNIDFATENLKEDEIENRMRFMSLSNSSYTITTKKDGTERTTPVLGYMITWQDKDEIDTDRCNDVYELASAALASAEMVGETEKEITVVFKILSSYGNIIVVEDTYNSNGYRFVELSPKESVINSYFDSVEGFEKLLLRTDTTPLYKNSFLKMFETDNGIRYAYRDYVWPRVNDYCIDIESPSYVAFVDSLMETAIDFDEMWCDNLWRNMTHESLRNYDWTYTKDFTKGEEADNVDGGNRLEKLIRIYGRVFDDLKRYIDGIRFSAKISYDGFNNMPSAEISDRLNYNGWEIYTTIPNFKGMETVAGSDLDLSNVYLNEECVSTDGGNDKPKWFNAINPLEVNAGSNDIDFLRTLALSSKYLIQSKGTTCGIDMIMGLFGIGSDNDETLSYKITERYIVTDVRNYGRKLKSAIADLVHYDSKSYYYDDPYEGVPIGDVEINGKKYIVPFYDSNKYYKGEFTFQSNGGWYKKSMDASYLNDYEETLSYLNVVSDFASLLTVNTFSLEKYGDEEPVPLSNIYYVVDPSDYINYTENVPYNLTHFFYIKDIFNPQLADSWMPILYEYLDINDVIDKSQYDAMSVWRIENDPFNGTIDNPIGDSVQDYAAIDAFYLYICNGSVVRMVEKNDYINGTNLGYVSNSSCETDDSHFYSCKFEFPTNFSYLNRLNDEQAEQHIINGGRYIPSSLVVFVAYGYEGLSDKTFDQWIALPQSERNKYEINESSFFDAYTYYRSGTRNSIVNGFVCDLDMMDFYNGSRQLLRNDYTPLANFYTFTNPDYILFREDEEDPSKNVYVRRYTGDIELYERAQYLDSILSTNIGNNPHVGYGKYDLGQEYKDYMSYPFKYYEDNYVLPETDNLRSYSLIYPSDNEESELVTVNDETYNGFGYINGSNLFVDLNDGSFISYASYRELLDADPEMANNYAISIERLSAAIANQTAEQTSESRISVKGLYSQDGYVFRDISYNLYEYETNNKIKNISDVYEYVDGYTTEITEDEFNSIEDTDEKDKWEREVDSVEDGVTVYKYVKSITVEEYNELPDSEKSKYYKTIAKVYSRDRYRDIEDSLLPEEGGDRYMGDDDSAIADVPTYYLNSKLIVMEFKNTNQLFKRYFLDVIGKYVMQLMPSTAITVMLFDCDEPINNQPDIDDND